MKRKNAWLSLLIFLPLVALIVGINVFADPANIYHNIGREMAKAVEQGTYVYVPSGNLDEREFKRKLIEDMPSDIDCVVVGPSVCMLIRSNNVGTDSFYNLGLSGADYYDILAQFGMMDYLGKTPKRVIFCVDQYFFNKTAYESLTRHTSLKPYADYMLNVLNDVPNKRAPHEDDPAMNIERVHQAFSIQYFQSSWAYFKSLDSLNIQRFGIYYDGYDSAYYMQDASLVYGAAFDEKSEERTVSAANVFDLDSQFGTGEHMDLESAETFSKLVDYLNARKTEVTFYLSPISPALYERLLQDKEAHPIIWEIEDYVKELSLDKGIDLQGSYNPYNVDMTNLDYYDSMHVREDSILEHFDLLGEY